MNALAGLMFVMMALAPQQGVSESPERVEYCDLVQTAERFASKMIVVHARLTELKDGEWGLDSHCFQPTLLVFPTDVQPRPDFHVEENEGLRLMLQARRERRVVFFGDFTGRFDVAQKNSGEPGRVTFGNSRSRMRLVLRDIQKAERIAVPRR
jgi:hypothetical protein